MTTKAWDRGTGPSVWRGLLGGRRPVRTGPAALLWDMDGLLVDSEPVWTVAERELFARWGMEFTPAMKAAMVGSRLEVAVARMLEFGAGACGPDDAASVSGFLLGRMAELFAAALPLQPGAWELLAAARAAGVPQALVSSSYRVLVDAVLAGMPDHPFTVSVAGDEVSRGKPDPESYLLAASRLGVSPADCIVLEDTPTGARAGAGAGARVLYCPSMAQLPPAEPGWWPVRSLREVSLAGLAAWSAR